MKKIAFLVLAHKDISHLISYAVNHTNINFYIHLDGKVDLEDFLKNTLSIPTNMFLLTDRISINWAGFSMVQATLYLIKFALMDSDNEYFHFISGDDVILQHEEFLKWESDEIFIENYETIDNRYRLRFNFIHSDTNFQRKFIFKLITQIFKKIDFFLVTRKKYYCGSQWFSIKRKELLSLIETINESDIRFFRKKLCPDEHFFQFILNKSSLKEKISLSGNKRLIIFDKKFQNGSSPLFLNFEQLSNGKDQGYWFARKVNQDTINQFNRLMLKKY